MKNYEKNILAAKLAEAHTMHLHVPGLNLACMEYVIHSIPPLPPRRKTGLGASREVNTERGARSFTLLLP